MSSDRAAASVVNRRPKRLQAGSTIRASETALSNFKQFGSTSGSFVRLQAVSGSFGRSPIQPETT
eukprot:2620740-Alexandrium_andersonii.AAC.1